MEINPKNILAFDTSTENISISLQIGEKTSHYQGAGAAATSKTLIPQIMQMLKEQNTKPSQLAAIAYGAGPGAFTGVRAACAAAQGLSYGAGIKVIPIDTLQATAQDALQKEKIPQGSKILAMLDARMNQTYSAIYELDQNQNWQQKTQIKVQSPDETKTELEQIGEQNIYAIAGNIHPENLKQIKHIKAEPSASAIKQLAKQKIQNGEKAKPPHEALPIYIRDKVALTTKEREEQKTK